MAEPLGKPAKARMAKGEVALGLNIRLVRSPEIVRIARASGHHFLFIDGQHAAFNLETVRNLVDAALALGVAPLVRVLGVGDPQVPLLLDCGALGIIFPDVATADDAQRAAEACRFAPEGRRSVTAGYPQFDYRSLPLGQSLPQLNATCLVVCMVETPQGVANAAAIAAVPGVDVVHVGANDLAVAMGLAGQFEHPDVLDAVEQVIDATLEQGKFAGAGGLREVAWQARAVRRGARFLTTQSDIGLLANGAAAWADALQQELARA
jgi:2-keto-3-deoxy-L-rhamnonate aldolase RhmA